MTDFDRRLSDIELALNKTEEVDYSSLKLWELPPEKRQEKLEELKRQHIEDMTDEELKFIMCEMGHKTIREVEAELIEMEKQQRERHYQALK
jgi:hypothetical protein